MEELLDYEGLIYSIIGKVPKRYDREDLYQVGMIGLMDAYKHYDSSYDTKFSTFAYYYILGEVNKYIRNSSSLKVSDDLIKLNKKIIKTRELMTQKLGRVPSNLEISLYLDISEELVDQAILATSDVEGLDELYNIGVSDSISPDLMDLREEIGKLSDEEKKLIYARYFQGLTQNETSSILGMSQVQVSRNESKILKKLRSQL